MLPWDDDIDIVLIDESINRIKKLHQYETDDLLIEVNPYSKNRNTNDAGNRIDARVISKINGVFIDITYLTPSRFRWGVVNCKFSHYYKYDDICPVTETLFEGIPIYVPKNIDVCLAAVYGKLVFNNWKFDGQEWRETTEGSC